MVREYHQLNGHESEQSPGDSEGQGSLMCCMQYMGSQRVRHNLVTDSNIIKNSWDQCALILV